MNKKSWMIVMGSVTLVGAVTLSPAAQAAPAGTARLMVVQALPGQVVDVALDGTSVGKNSETGSVLGPFDVPAGQHDLAFTDASGEVVLATDVNLGVGTSQDLVVHLPAEVDGDPVATTYETPTEPINGDKARVLIAHTATVAPADVRVDGTVVFRNIANGEFAVADVAAGDHVAELLPAGLTTRPILGPIDVTLAARTATMVYAVGDPKQESMAVIAHSISLGGTATKAPSSIDAGSAGLASDIVVTPFSARGTDLPAPGTPAAALRSGAVAALVLALALVVMVRRRLPGGASL